MTNPYRNEMQIKIGGEEILLRPTFENIAAMEAVMGSVAFLGWKYSRGARLQQESKAQESKAQESKAGHVSLENVIRAMPGITELAQVIYFNQAAHDPEDSTKKKFTLEEIWKLVSAEGVTITKEITLYISKICAGSNEVDEVKAETEEVKA
jgi:translation initiation factor 2B subunit (eIF-2B alpha/beta/delta family)